jgi:hypothetical protein
MGCKNQSNAEGGQKILSRPTAQHAMSASVGFLLARKMQRGIIYMLTFQV